MLANAELILGREHVSRPSFLRSTYFFLGTARSIPALGTKNKFKKGPAHPSFGFLHAISDHWGIGLTAGFKILRDKETNAELPIAGFNQETHYFTRIYHPLYFMTSGKFSYLLPAESAVVPFRRERNYDTEVGVGMSVGVAFFPSPALGLYSYWERWRGTKTMKFHGLESGFRVLISF